MDERLKFIARLPDGEKMAVVCRAFGISRKTGYKILTRYNEVGLDGLTDRSLIGQAELVKNNPCNPLGCRDLYLHKMLGTLRGMTRGDHSIEKSAVVSYLLYRCWAAPSPPN